MEIKPKFSCVTEGFFKTKEELIEGFLYKDYSIELHNHDFYELNIIMSGTGRHTIEKASYTVHIGDVFVIPPNIVHGYDQTKSLEVQHILIHPDFFEKYAKERSQVKGFDLLFEIEPFLRINSNSLDFLHLYQEQILRLQNDLEIINKGSEYDCNELIPLKNHVMEKILYMLSYRLDRQLKKNDFQSQDCAEKSMVAILEYIHNHYDEKITISKLSSMAYLSRSTFLRKFKSMCGCTATEYIIGQRLKAATALLKSGQKTKTEIAHECGFFDLSHMEHTFKQMNLIDLKR